MNIIIVFAAHVFGIHTIKMLTAFVVASDELYLSPVLSTRAHAAILDVDSAEAQEMPGVVRYIDYRDIAGANYMDMYNMDEEVLATNEVFES